ncbi:MAG TPA: DUF3592 domain-containing protein [Gemmataceae bacterium]
MSWAEDTKLRLQLFAIVLTFMCPVFLILQISETKRQIASTSWPSVTGEVQGIDAKTWLDKDNNTKYYGRVTYRYLVEGKEYTTDLTDLGPGTKRADRDAALADVSGYRPGMKVTVYYDPSDPGVGIIQNGIPTIHLVLLIGLGIGTLVGAVASFFTVRGWIRGSRQKRDEARLRQHSEAFLDVSAAPVQDAQLGERIAVFKPMMSNIIAGFIIGALLIVGGAAAIGFSLRAAYLAHWDLPFDVKKGPSWLTVGFLSLIGVVLVVCGVALAAFSRGLLSHGVDICANGFRYCWRRSTENVLWSGISRIKETILYERPPLLKGPAKLLLPKVSSTSYMIVTKSGTEYGFDGNTIAAIKRFGRVLREQAERLSLPWETVEEHA